MIKQVFLLFCGVSYVLCSPEHTDHGAAAHKSSHFKDGIHNPVFDKEALMGKQDIDELAELEPEVRMRRLINLAKSHDANNNGIIESDELKNWILESFKLLDREEAIDRMKEDDENEDNQVTFAEILNKQYGYTEEDVANLGKGTGDGEDEEEETNTLELIEEDRKRFTVADLDKDGILSEAEYLPYFQPYDYPHMHEMEMEKAMKDLDTNGDKLISLEEFIGDNTDEESRLSESTNFESLDKDKDGLLTSEELRPWALPDNEEVAMEEVEHLVTMCDTDDDGHLSIEEIVYKEEEFIGSSATDYGRNLHFVRDEL